MDKSIPERHEMGLFLVGMLEENPNPIFKKGDRVKLKPESELQDFANGQHEQLKRIKERGIAKDDVLTLELSERLGESYDGSMQRGIFFKELDFPFAPDNFVLVESAKQ